MALALVIVGLAGATFSQRAGAAETGASAVGTTDTVEPDTEAAQRQMTPAKAVVLGVVEGVTEYLPISSTGHLYVTQQLLGVGDTPSTEAPADSFAIVIQAGAILAVLVLYRRRIASVFEGLVGRSAEGRTVLVALVVAFLPAAVIGFVFEDSIKSRLFAAWPIVAAWAVGGIAILLLSDRISHQQQETQELDSGGAGSTAPTLTRGFVGSALEAITPRQALIIGVAQAAAMWPGTSRSLVTIVAAVLVGLSVPAAVEFSFLLGLLTLGAATAYETLSNGSLLMDSYGGVEIALGLAVAFVTAAAAVTWMVRWLERRTLAVFGWYRLGIAGVGAALILGGAIK
ncbi:MAG: undecaprenyl-diphosphate phosphatase [Microthrixaceae bacterium]